MMKMLISLADNITSTNAPRLFKRMLNPFNDSCCQFISQLSYYQKMLKVLVPPLVQHSVLEEVL